MSSPRDGLTTPYRKTKKYCETVPPCPCLHGRPTFGPSCTEFVYPGCWHFDNDATSKFDDVLLEHGGQLHRGDHSKMFQFVSGTPPSCFTYIIAKIGRHKSEDKASNCQNKPNQKVY